jgi:AsmA protein
MLRVFKICLLTVGVLVVVAIAGAITLVTLVNPNRYKGQITQQIYKATGRQATIGNISWSVFPWIKLQINDVTLNNPAGFPSSPFVSVGHAAVSANVMALLKRELIIDSIAVNDMQVNLIRTLNNSNNWTMQSTTDTATTSSSKATTSTNKGTIKTFNINAIAISNATVNWQDATKNQNISFKINSLNTKNINFNGNTFTLNSSFTYQTAKIPQPVNIKLSADINANKNTQQYNIDDLELNVNQFEVTGKANISQLPSPTLNASLSIPTANIATLLNELGYPINFQNKSALTNVGGDITLVVKKNSAQINNLTLGIDGAKINGQVNLTQLKPLSGNFTLAVDKFNLDQYQTVTTTPENNTPSTTVASNMPATVPAQTSNQSTLPSCLQTANITGKLTVGSLQVNKMQLQQVNVPIAIKNSEFIASPITAQFYQGTLQADAKANYSTAVPSYFLSAALNNVNMNALLQQAADFNKLNGTGQINFLVNTSGNDKNSILEALNGNGKIELTNGSYVGIDIMNIINSAASLFFKQEPVTATGPAQTNFTAVKATFQINNGLIANNDLLLSSPVMNVTGNGTVSLVTQAIDYNLSVTPIGNVIPQLANLQKAIGGNIPVKVKGSISNPKVTPDMEKISMAATKQTINKNLNDISKGVDDFSKGVAKTLNQMFGN